MKNWKAYPLAAFEAIINLLDRVKAPHGERDGLEVEHAVNLLRRAASYPGVPTDLTFRVRSLISRDRTRKNRPHWTWRCKNWLEQFMVPASVGVLTALICFGTFVRIFEIPVQAKSGDIPLLVRTEPRLRSIALLSSAEVDCVKAEILIDESGRVADVRILKVHGLQTPASLRNLQNVFLFAVFDPATTFGRPTAEKVTVALRDGKIHGVSL